MSSLLKSTIFIKRVVLEEIFVFRDTEMLEHLLIEGNGSMIKRNFFDFRRFRRRLNLTKSNNYE